MKRRAFLTGCAAVPFLGLSLPSRADELRQSLADSNLVYLSPLKSDGQLSSCQAEVWYVMLGADVLVCTSAQSWRATAPGKGLSRTRIWAGDKGVWRSGEYQSLPSALVNASIEADEAQIEAALSQFGFKYSAEWSTWGPRFRNGLKDGSRALLRYKLA